MTTQNYDVLRDQIKSTISNIEHNTVTREDRVFITHLLEEVQSHLDTVENPGYFGFALIGQAFQDVVGSTQELINDGLIQEEKTSE